MMIVILTVPTAEVEIAMVNIAVVLIYAEDFTLATIAMVAIEVIHIALVA